MKHWTPTGVEPKDYDDDDDSLLLTAFMQKCLILQDRFRGS